MIIDQLISNNIIKELIKTGSVKLNPNKPFTWASGRISPIYCDNRTLLYYPDSRTIIRDAFCEIIKKIDKEYDIIAGVATGAIAHGILIADVLKKPFIYVRDKPKGHGRQNVIEGEIQPGKKVLVIEDGITTGGSSLKAIKYLSDAGFEVVYLISIFSYDFKITKEEFKKAGCDYYSLCDFPSMIEMCKQEKLYSDKDIKFMEEWWMS